MGRTHTGDSTRRRWWNRGDFHYGPIVWIILLLACWIVIADWRALPEVISNAMAALSLTTAG